jgi:hypothetical protein
MKHPSTPPDDSWESDAVWKLLDQAPMKTPSPRFLDDTVRAARLLEIENPWWHRWFAPIPLAGLATATAALCFAAISWVGPAPESGVAQSASSFQTAHAVDIEEIAEMETLLAAADYLDDFSNHEIASLIGF